MKSIDHFFDSYQPIPVNKDLHVKLVEFVDSVRAYAVLLPTVPKSINNMTQNNTPSLKTDLMISIDPRSGSYYFIGYTETTKGYAFQNDSSTISSVHENMLAKFQDITRDSSYTVDDKRILELDGSMMNGSMQSKTKIMLRGNRYYTLLIMYGPGKWDETANQVMSSFQLKQYPNQRWKNNTSPDSLFSSWTPDAILFSDRNDSSNESKAVSYESYDSIRANTYSIKLDAPGTYYWTKNDSALWKSQKETFMNPMDTVLSERIFKKDGIYQYELFKRAGKGKNIQRMQMMIMGEQICRLTVSQESGTIREENVNRFFDQFRFYHPGPKTHLFESKATILLKDLQSPDSATRQRAYTALPQAPFDKTDIGLLQESVLKTFASDSNWYKSVNQIIAERITELDDSSSVEFARAHFVTASRPDIKDALLKILSAYKTKPNYEVLGKLLMSSPPLKEPAYWVTRKWYDSLRVSTSLFPTVLPLLKDSIMVSAILDIASELLDSNLISISIFEPWQETILNYADRRYRTVIADTSYFMVSDYSLINLMKRFRNSASTGMMKKWLQVKYNIYHKQQIVMAFLENNQPISQQALNELAANKDTRMELYRNLKKHKKTSLFPVKFLTQSYFAESLAGDAAAELDNGEAEISLIKVKELKWKGKTSRFFFYDVFMAEDNEHWLVASGPYNMNRADVSFSEAGSDLYSEEQYDSSNAANQMKAIVEQMEKNR